MKDAFIAARLLGLTLHPRVRRGALLVGNDLYFDGTAALERQRVQIRAKSAVFAGLSVVAAHPRVLSRRSAS